jgi:hypothetical protein
MADDYDDYKAGRPCTPVSKRGSPATPAAAAKKLHALLADALSEPVFVTIDGERRQIPSALPSAGPGALLTLMLFGMPT